MNSLKRMLVLMLVVVCGAMAGSSAGDAERDLEAAINKEVVQGDVTGAMALYRRILSRYGSQREVTAKALFHLGQCHEKLGQAEARKSYERVVSEFGDQKQVAAKARSRLTILAAPAAGSFAPRLIDPSGECASVTPDGQLAGCSRNGNLYVRNLGSGKELLAARDIGRYDLFALSPDGKWVAYNSTAAHGATLWLSTSEGSAARKLEGPASRPRSVAFSNDSEGVFTFSRQTGKAGELWLYPVRGGAGRKLYESATLMSITNPVFSPDGQFVVYRGQIEGSADSQVWALPVKGGEPRELAVMKRATPAGFTSDGRLVIHGSGNDGKAALWTVGLRAGQVEGQPQLLAPDVSIPGRYHPGGRYYYTRTIGRSDMLSAELDGTPPFVPKPATDRGESRGVSPAYAPDGRSLAYIDRGKNVVVVRDLQSRTDRDYQTGMRLLFRVRWYADGSALFVYGSRMTDRDEIGVRLDLTSGNVSEVLPSSAAGPGGRHADASFNPMVSQDGRYIYYKRFYPAAEPRRVHRYDLKSGKAEEVYRAPNGDALRLFSISPDGGKLAVICSNPDGHWIGVAPVAGGETTVIHNVPKPVSMRGFSGLEWSADGRSILFHTASSEDTDNLWQIGLDGSAPRRLLTTPGIITNITAHPDGREITFASMDSREELWVIEGLK